MNKFKEFFQYLPMDMARLVSSPALLGYRHRRIHVSGEKYKGKLKGGAIIVANHIDFGDPFVLGTCFWQRRMYFLAAKEVMGSPLRTLLLKGVGCISIDREISDINAIRKCVGVLKKGKCLAVFPQGGIQQSTQVEQIKSGAILIAMQAGVPIIPVFSAKRKHWWQRRRTIIGDPLFCKDICPKKFPTMADIQNLSNILLEKMEACEKTYEQQ